MRQLRNCFYLFLLFAAITGCSSDPVRILVFSKTEGYRHASIEKGQEKIQAIADENGWEAVFTEETDLFTENELKNFSVVVWLSTTGNVLDYWQQADFERYIQAGGGYVGIHASTDTEYDWKWYGRMAGAWFKSHPKIQEAHLYVNPHSTTEGMDAEFDHTDEWYNFKDLAPDLDILVTIDESTYEGGENGDNHPISWVHEFEGGNVFYTNFGHREETWDEPFFLTHIEKGIEYAVGANKRDYSKAISERVPEENRLVRTILLQNLEEPMELDFIDDTRLLFIERQGNLQEYNLETEEMRTVHTFEVFGGLEEGLLGLAVDPNYEENNWIYVYYSDTDKPVDHLSRFTYIDGVVDTNSEKILLDVEVMRGDACCHFGGSIEFGPDGLLYLSTGDNTNPFESAGFAPIDERPGRQAWDAQRSAANPNDLRGKILRIHPMDDGTYQIPEGNLFPVGTENTRPEIYVMGLRNPFRISIDSKNNWLYWGDVGPDAGKTRENRGPKGIDELNQARAAGFFGWPYTRGNNISYVDFNFTTDQSGESFDPSNPKNDSPNNTGIQDLPPIQESLIWYSYDESQEFPWVGVGGKNPMAGPIIYSDNFTGVENPYPDYFDGKVFFYDWIRDWIFLIGLDENGGFNDAMPFMPNTVFNNPMDMVFGPDGSLYLLEYGESWKTRNLDARLNRITYVSGNRTPVARIEASAVVGAAPLTIEFDGTQSVDFDDDPLTYSWLFDGQGMGGSSPKFTFDEPGRYDVELTVRDPEGLTSTAKKEIIVGNDPPQISISLDSENKVFWDNRKLGYSAEIADTEDGSSADASFPKENVNISFTYIPEGEDLVNLGHQVDNELPEGQVLVEGSDCKACHAIDKKVNGPSYRDIAAKYNESDKEFLADKIIEGGSGVWGENMMSAHPQLDKEDVLKMVEYILGTGVKPDTEQSLPLKGELVFDQHFDTEGLGKYAMMVNYTDQGAGDIPELTDQEIIYFVPALREAEENDGKSNEVSVWSAGGSKNLGMVTHGRYFMYNEVDVSALSQITMRCYYVANYQYGGTVEVRIGSEEGELIGSAELSHFSENETHVEEKIAISPRPGVHDLYFVFKNDTDDKQYVANVDWVFLGFR